MRLNQQKSESAKGKSAMRSIKMLREIATATWLQVLTATLKDRMAAKMVANFNILDFVFASGFFAIGRMLGD
jgi:hypothetical protein